MIGHEPIILLVIMKVGLLRAGSHDHITPERVMPEARWNGFHLHPENLGAAQSPVSMCAIEGDYHQLAENCPCFSLAQQIAWLSHSPAALQQLRLSLFVPYSTFIFLAMRCASHATTINYGDWIGQARSGSGCHTRVGRRRR